MHQLNTWKTYSSLVKWLSAPICTAAEPSSITSVSKLLMSEKYHTIYAISCCVYIVLTQYSNGFWFEADWLPSDIVKCSTSDRKVAGLRLTGDKLNGNKDT